MQQKAQLFSLKISQYLITNAEVSPGPFIKKKAQKHANSIGKHSICSEGLQFKKWPVQF